MKLFLEALKNISKWLLIFILFVLYLSIYIVVSISISLQLSLFNTKYTDRFGNKRKYGTGFGTGFGTMMSEILIPFNIQGTEDRHYKSKAKSSIMNKYNQVFFSLFEWLKKL